MKILATNNFNDKLNSYTEETIQNKFYELIQEIEESGNYNTLLKNSQLNYDNVYVYKLDNYRLFFSVDEERVIFVDIIKKESQRIRIPSKNPINNPSINPSRNPSINPDRNPSINPNRNPSINPNRNPSINPDRNPSINPNRNPSINPNRNPSINPDRNPSINPNRNPSINPLMNPSFNGLYLYDLKGSEKYFIVNVNEKIILIYDFNNQVKYLGIYMNKGYSLFEYDTLHFTNYLITDGQNGFNQFDLNGNWIGYAK